MLKIGMCASGLKEIGMVLSAVAALLSRADVAETLQGLDVTILSHDTLPGAEHMAQLLYAYLVRWLGKGYAV